MKSKVFKVIFILLFYSLNVFSQNKIKLIINEPDQFFKDEIINVYEKDEGFLKSIKIGDNFEIELDKNEIKSLILISDNYPVIEKEISLNNGSIIYINLPSKIQELNEVIVNAKKKKIFELRRLKDYEGTSIFAGKKSEVISLSQSISNLASNNSRQIYSQIAGLNIFENDDAGLQLNIGGRGLDPNRTSNFNTRQNSYDISADVLGYPESYYSPPAEAIEEIQILRGAASLQYGTQFGGLVNFVLKSTNTYKPLEIITRNTLGSNNLYTNFTSISSFNNSFRIYGFVNYKKGDGFRPNSNFNSLNTFIQSQFIISESTNIITEITYLKYLAQQAGGLTDQMFYENPFQSNRSRNWFEVNWLLYNLKINHKFSESTNLSANFFGLNASRNALGFRTNRVSQIDSMDERDLIKGEFNNIGAEIRFLKNYSIFNNESTWVIGSKLYNSNTESKQGPGSNKSDANFNFHLDEFPFYNFQSSYKYPNFNLALFSENIFNLNDKLSITPGIRLEYIKTESDGSYKKINRDAAGNVIMDELIDNSEIRKRKFILLGAGISYKLNKSLETYFNISQNYRSVTFADISIFNPAFSINPDISDEYGSTSDIGVRGILKNYFSYDISAFVLNYKNRIGFTQKVTSDGRVKTERGNVGNARIIGIESLIDFNLSKLFFPTNKNLYLNYFINFSSITSKYIFSQEPGVTGKKVEFIPDLNLKSGMRFGYKNFQASLQYSRLSDQFTDSSNSIDSNLSGVIGLIPGYKVLDFSSSYKINNFKFEAGVNNFLNEIYFTRRATGYPGPGIIPSAPRTFYLTIEFRK